MLRLFCEDELRASAGGRFEARSRFAVLPLCKSSDVFCSLQTIILGNYRSNIMRAKSYEQHCVAHLGEHNGSAGPSRDSPAKNAPRQSRALLISHHDILPALPFIPC